MRQALAGAVKPQRQQDIAPMRQRRYSVGERLITAVDVGEGPRVVCLHGFPDNRRSFRYQIPALLSAGYRVICPALPGYEPSSLRQDGRYDLDRVSDDLLALIDATGRTRNAGPVHLLGHDWGALAGYACVAKAPEQFRSFTALTIPYNLSLLGVLLEAPAYLRDAWYIQLFQVRGLAENLLARKQGQLIEQLIRRWSPTWEIPQAVLDDIQFSLRRPAVREAALGYYRAIYGWDKAARRARQLLNARIQVPTLMVGGQSDGCIHRDLWRLTRRESFPAGLQQQWLETGHFPHQERPDEFNALWLAWLAQQEV